MASKNKCEQEYNEEYNDQYYVDHVGKRRMRSGITQISKQVQEYDEEYYYIGPNGRRRRVGGQRELYETTGPKKYRGTIMAPTSGHTNLCIKDIMSRCGAVEKTNSNLDKHACQKTCTYYIKATQAERCLFEVFEEYCWSITAQNVNEKVTKWMT